MYSCFLQNQISWSKLSGTYINQKQPFTGNYNAYRKVLIYEVAGLQPKKDTGIDVFLWVSLQPLWYFRTLFLQNMFGWPLLLLNTIHYLCYIDLISKMLPPTLVMFWLSLNIFMRKHCGSLVSRCFWKSRQLVDLLLAKQEIHPKFC